MSYAKHMQTLYLMFMYSHIITTQTVDELEHIECGRTKLCPFRYGHMQLQHTHSPWSQVNPPWPVIRTQQLFAL